jgi:hypothetical protein
MITLTLFTKSYLTKLGSPIAPNIISNTSSDSNWNDDGKEDTNSRSAMFLFKLVFMAGTRVGFALVELSTVHTCSHRDSSITCWCIVFCTFYVHLADERVIWRRVASNKCTRAIRCTFIVEITAK